MDGSLPHAAHGASHSRSTHRRWQRRCPASCYSAQRSNRIRMGRELCKRRGLAPNAIELHPVLDVIFNPALSNPPTITAVNTVGGLRDIAQNTWIEIHGTNLAPSSVGPSGM